MLQLNVHLQYYSGMPPPNRAVVITRTAARSLKIVVKSLFQRGRGRRATDTEEGGEEKTAKKASEEYQQVLQNTFGNSERINDVMRNVTDWIDGM